MKFIKFEERQWTKRGRICYANPYQIHDIHWPASPDGKPVNIYLNDGWKVVADTESLRYLATFLNDEYMTEEKRNALLQNAIRAAQTWKEKEGTAGKTADTEEKED